MGLRLGSIFDRMKTNTQMDIKPFKVWLIILFALIYPVCSKLFAFKGPFADLAYYLVLLCMFMANRRAFGDFLRLPAKSGNLPVFSGYRVDIFFTYPLLLAALVSILNSILVQVGIIPADVQGLSAVKFTFVQLVALCAGLPLTAIVEELFNLLMVVTIYKTLKLPGRLGLAASILAASLMFGLLHIFSWNLNAAFAIGISFIPLFIMTLYLKSIWVSVLAHFYNDLIIMTGLYSPVCRRTVIILILIPCLLGIIKELFTSKSKSSNI